MPRSCLWSTTPDLGSLSSQRQSLAAAPPHRQAHHPRALAVSQPRFPITHPLSSLRSMEISSTSLSCCSRDTSRVPWLKSNWKAGAFFFLLSVAGSTARFRIRLRSSHKSQEFLLLARDLRHIFPYLAQSLPMPGWPGQ